MDYSEKISTHYSHENLVASITAGLNKQDIRPENATVEDLGPVDEFHIGGRIASGHFLDQLDIRASQTLLDIGCGLGGSARFVAKTYGASVVGVDLTPDYIEAGRVLCDWVGLSDQIELHHGSALALPFDDASFDGAFMMHVGMNIADKMALFAEIGRVLRPGAKFGVYDVMKANDEELVYPVPWATNADTSWLAPLATYRSTLEAAGFAIVTETDRSDFAKEFFRKMKEKMTAEGGPPPLGLHVLMQQTTAEKIPNMVANLMAQRIAPVEVIAVKSG